MRTVHGVDQLEALAGQEIGASRWLAITQEMVNAFAALTRDPQWIHVDVERARRESPYGGPIVHGFLILALLPSFRQQILTMTGVSRLINYGVDRVRFPHAVPVGARVRGVLRVTSVTRTAPDAVRVASTVVVEVEGETKAACVAETVMLVYA